MKKLIKLLILAALLAGIISTQAAQPLRVFIRGGVKTHGPNQHDHPRFLAEWTKLLGERGMKVSGDLDYPEAEQLDKTDVLIIYAADGMKIAGTQRADLEKFLQRGGGLVVLHDGVVSGDQYEWCKSTIGGAWRWSAADLPKEKATKWFEGNVGVCWVDQAHPITRGVSNFDWQDEIYYDMDLAPDIGVLATSFHNVHIIAPQIWTYEKTLAGGAKPYRAFVSLPGHDFEVFNTPQYRTVLLRGIAWAGHRTNVDEFCKKEELASLLYPPGGPLPAKEAMKTFNLHPEFNIALVADENIAEKIMSLEWDPRGRLWVVETPEYPGGRDINKNDGKITPWRLREPGKFPIGGKEPRANRDRVSILEDTNGDGVMDKKTVFADGLELATSVVLYKDGAIVTQAPDILWLRDTNGDGKADKVEVLFRLGHGRYSCSDEQLALGARWLDLRIGGLQFRRCRLSRWGKKIRSHLCRAVSVPSRWFSIGASFFRLVQYLGLRNCARRRNLFQHRHLWATNPARRVTGENNQPRRRPRCALGKFHHGREQGLSRAQRNPGAVPAN